MKTKIVVIGVGNLLRGDDGAGLYAARALRDVCPKSVEVFESTGEGAVLLDLWEDAELAIIVDAFLVTEASGESLLRFDATVEPLPQKLFGNASTHLFGVADSIELARVLKRLPKRLIVVAIGGRCFETGTTVSDEVRQGIRRAVSQILMELRDYPKEGEQHA